MTRSTKGWWIIAEQYQFRNSKGLLVPFIRIADFIGDLLFWRKKEVGEIKSILVIQPANFGDVVVTLPTIKGLKDTFPKGDVDVLVKESLVALTSGLSYIRHTFALQYDWMTADGKVLFKPLFEFMKTPLYKTLKEEKYDLVVDVHGDPRNIWLAWRLGGKIRAGFGMRGLGFLLTHKAKFDPDAHIIDRYFETVRRFAPGAEIPDACFLKKKSDAKNILLHPGTGLEIKQWTIDGWAKVADFLINEGQTVKFTCSEQEKQMVDEIVSKMELKNLIQIIVVKKMPTWYLELINCRLFISVDTGPAHLAHAMGVPTLQLFGPSMAKRWGYENVCSVESECMNELECKYGFENRCMAKLQPDVVIKKAKEVLNEVNA